MKRFVSKVRKQKRNCKKCKGYESCLDPLEIGDDLSELPREFVTGVRAKECGGFRDKIFD